MRRFLHTRALTLHGKVRCFLRSIGNECSYTRVNMRGGFCFSFFLSQRSKNEWANLFAMALLKQTIKTIIFKSNRQIKQLRGNYNTEQFGLIIT